MSFKSIIVILLIVWPALLICQTVPITVMTYNILDFPNGNTNANGGDAARIQHFTDIVELADADVIMVQELTSSNGADMLLTEMNTNGTLGKTYARAPSFFPSIGLGNMLFYNTGKLQLVSQNSLPQPNTMQAPNGNTQNSPRIICEFIMEVVNPACPQEKTEIRFYDQHLKAGQDPASGGDIADSDRRFLGAQDLMDHVNALPLTVNVIAGGDFNFYGDNVSNSAANPEPGYTTIVAGTNANPLIDDLGGWTRNIPGDIAKYTQSTRNAVGNNAYGNNGTGGGLDDRFDLLFFNNAVNANTNFVQYVAGSYQTFGSTGVPHNGQADNGTSPLANDIQYMSDHYPVILKLDVTFETMPSCCDIPTPVFMNK